MFAKLIVMTSLNRQPQTLPQVLGVYINKAPYHASQFGVELSGKRFHQVHVITSGCFKQHLERFKTIVCHAVHCATQKRTLFSRQRAFLWNLFVFLAPKCQSYRSSQVCLESREAPTRHCEHRSNCALHPG